MPSEIVKWMVHLCFETHVGAPLKLKLISLGLAMGKFLEPTEPCQCVIRSNNYLCKKFKNINVSLVNVSVLWCKLITANTLKPIGMLYNAISLKRQNTMIEFN